MKNDAPDRAAVEAAIERHDLRTRVLSAKPDCDDRDLVIAAARAYLAKGVPSAEPVAWKPDRQSLRVLASAMRKVWPDHVDEFIDRAVEALSKEQYDDNESDSGCARRLAGEGDGNQLQAGRGDRAQRCDSPGQHDAGLLHPQQHAHSSGGNATDLDEPAARSSAQPEQGSALADLEPLIEALMNYQRADEDGVMVLVSRQALHEAADILRASTGAEKAVPREPTQAMRIAAFNIGDPPEDITSQWLLDAFYGILDAAQKGRS